MPLVLSKLGLGIGQCCEYAMVTLVDEYAWISLNML